MPKTKISEFSSTPANNTDIDSINIAEGCAPSGINDAIRELMSQLKDWQSGTSNDPMVIGSSGSLTLNQGTANGVAYLNGSKVVTSGSALTFTGTRLGIGEASPVSGLTVKSGNGDQATFNNAGERFTQLTLQNNGTSKGAVWLDNTNSLLELYGYSGMSLTFSANGSEGMRLTSTGLGIGTSSPTTRLSITDSTGPIVRLVRTSNRFELSADTDFMSLNARDASTYITFKTADTERARIDSSGNLLVGTTSTSNGALINWYKASGTIETSLGGITTAQNHIVFANPNGNVGSIQVNGSATSYNTSSDYRLKNTIAPMTGALAKVALLKPCTYKWNVDGSDGEGFIAHELAEVVPQCVTGEKDAVDEEGNPKYQGIDTSFLVATLTAAIQELNTKFEAYKASHP